MNDITMNAWEAISATKAECFITIDNEHAGAKPGGKA